MSWETITPSRGRRTRDCWAIVVKPKYIALWMPTKHRLAADGKVETQIGKGEHLGMLRLRPAPSGRAVNRAKSGGVFLRYATLPFAPAEFPLTEIHAIDNADGSTDLVLPWKMAVRTVEVA